MTIVNPNPELAKYIDGGVVIPAGTHEHLWVIAAAWAGTTVKELLADTAPVRAAHYEAAVRVEKALDAWDTKETFVAKAEQAKTTVVEDLREAAGWLAKAAAAQPAKASNDAADWARASSQIYQVCASISHLKIVQGL